MVNPVELTNDIVATAASLALPGVLWAFLFLLAWEAGPFAESIGFGRKAFWLLSPGAVLASFALLPFAPISNDYVAVSFGGALFPLFVGALAFGRASPPRRRSLALYLGVLAVEGAVLLVLVLPTLAPLVNALASSTGLATGASQTLFVAVTALLLTSVVGLVALLTSDPVARPVAFALALTAGVLVLTFAVSSTVPGVGITEPFPLFLFPPFCAGVVAALVASRVYPGREGFALPTAYLATTFGVLLGADLLRQPPLYGSGAPGLYTIGGAGVLDLVYLSGLIALAGAFLGHRLLGRSFAAVPPGVPATAPTPVGRLGQAFRAGVTGRLSESLASSAQAGHEAADQARRLLGVPPAPADRPWQGLPVPGWVVSDQANLDAVAKVGTSDGREGFRTWLTARWLVYIGRDLGSRRFGSIGARVAGFLIDLTLVTTPAIVVWAVLVAGTPGNLVAALSSLPFNAAIYGFIAVAFLYLVLSETVLGTSVGKLSQGLVVRDRALNRPGFLATMVRNVSILPVLTVVGIGAAIATAFVLKAGSFTAVTVGGVTLPGGVLALVGVLSFTLGGVGLLGTLGVLMIGLTAERQRLGDVLAGTWVLRSTTPVGSAAAPGPSPAAPSRPGPPGPGPSG